MLYLILVVAVAILAAVLVLRHESATAHAAIAKTVGGTFVSDDPQASKPNPNTGDTRIRP